jgi:tRNA(Ile)-lysidine synthase
MLQKLQHHLENNLPHLKGKQLLLATSGGIDSMVLVHLLHQLNFNITVAHCNFMLREEESNGDENFVRTTCEALKIPFFIQKFDTNQLASDYKLSIQLAARKLRYEWFAELLLDKKLDYVLTGHHLDDEIETFLINLTRGTGLDGLTGIPSQNGTIIRPLLPFSREEIEKYAKDNQITWREDSSNASNKYLRNKLRHDVVPILKDLNPSFMHSFQNTLENLKQTQSLADDASRIVYKKVVQEEENQNIINISELTQLENFEAYLFQWLKPLGFTAWEDIYGLVHAQSGKQVFSNTHVVLKDRDKLIVFPKIEKEEIEEYFLNKNQKNLKFPLNISVSKVDNISNTTNYTIFVNEDKVQFPLMLRKKQEGDYFLPSGMNGKKKLSKYFKDEKYSLLDKEEQWILTSKNEIVWVIGKRADQRFLANETTQNIIKIEITE